MRDFLILATLGFFPVLCELSIQEYLGIIQNKNKYKPLCTYNVNEKLKI
jgi:hypothetical protein